MEDLGGRPGASLLSFPSGLKFSQFHAVFMKFGEIVGTPGELAPLLRELLHPPLHSFVTEESLNVERCLRSEYPSLSKTLDWISTVGQTETESH